MNNTIGISTFARAFAYDEWPRRPRAVGSTITGGRDTNPPSDFEVCPDTRGQP